MKYTQFFKKIILATAGISFLATTQYATANDNDAEEWQCKLIICIGAKQHGDSNVLRAFDASQCNEPLGKGIAWLIGQMIKCGASGGKNYNDCSPEDNGRNNVFQTRAVKKCKAQNNATAELNVNINFVPFLGCMTGFSVNPSEKSECSSDTGGETVARPKNPTPYEYMFEGPNNERKLVKQGKPIGNQRIPGLNEGQEVPGFTTIAP